MSWPDYRSKEQPPIGPGTIVQPVPLMPMPQLDVGGAKVGEATAKAGQALVVIGEQLFETQDKTAATKALSAFQIEAAQLESDTKYNNPTLGDKQNASAELASMRQRHLGNIIDETRRAATEHQMVITSIGVEKRIEQKAIAGMNDQQAAALAVQGETALRDWTGAATEGQRAGVQKSYETSVRNAIPAIGAQRAVQLIQGFNYMTSSAEATAALRENPTEGKRRMLAGEFPGITNPVQRQQWITHFDEADVRLRYEDVQQTAITKGPKAAREALDSYGFTPVQGVHARQIIDQVEKGQIAALKTNASEIASLARSENGMLNIIKDGLELDGRGDIAAYETTQRQAAELGSVAAQRELRKIEMWKTMAPTVRAAQKLGNEGLNEAIDVLDREQQRKIAAGEEVPIADIAMSNALKAVRSTRHEGLQKGPIAVGGMNGARLYQEEAIDFKNVVNDPAQQDRMARRGRQALTVNQNWGGSGSGFSEQEAIDEKKRYEQAGPLERYQTLDVIRKYWPDKVAIASMKQIAGDDFGSQAFFNLASTAPERAKQAVNGAMIRKDKNFADNEKEARLEMQSQLPTELYLDPRDQAAAESLVLSLSAYDRGQKGAFDRGMVTSAIKSVVGEVTTIGGKQVPVTPAVPFLNAGNFRDQFSRFNAEDWALAGGVFLDGGRRATPREVGSNATLQASGPGSPYYYLGRLSGAGEFESFKDASGAPVILNMPDLVLRHQTRPYVEPGTEGPRRGGHPFQVLRGTPPAVAQRAAPEDLEGDTAIRAELARQFPNDTEEQLAARFESMFARHEGERQLTGAAAIAGVTGAIGARVNPAAWDAAYEGWPASTNIEDRRAPGVLSLEGGRPRRSARE